MCFILFTVTSIHNIEKYTKIRNLEERLKVAQNIQGSKEIVIDLISPKKSEKDFQKNKLTDTQVESNLPLLLKNSSRQKTKPARYG